MQCLQAAAFYTGRRDPFNQLSRYWLAESYYNSGKYVEAVGIQTDLSNGSALDRQEEGRALPYNIAYSYFRSGDYQKAAQNYERVIAIDNKYILAHNNLGLAYENMGAFDKAIASFSQELYRALIKA